MADADEPRAEPTVEIQPSGSTIEIRPAEPTVEIPTRPRLHQSVWVVFVAVAAVGLLAGIGAASAIRAAPAGTVVADRIVGSAGGTLSFPGGQLRVPAGAIQRRVHITVRRAVIEQRLRVHAPEGPLYVVEPDTLVGYTFSPRDLTFARPAELVLTLSAKRRNAAVFAASGGAVLFLDGKVDPGAGTVSTELLDLRFGTGRASGG